MQTTITIKDVHGIFAAKEITLLLSLALSLAIHDFYFIPAFCLDEEMTVCFEKLKQMKVKV